MSSVARAVIAPIAYMEAWEDSIAMENGWTGDFTWVSGSACTGIYGMSASLSGTTTTANLTSPFIGIARGSNFLNLIGINYLITGSLGTGYIEIQYASTSSGPWTTVGTIDAQSHVVSATCSHYDVPEFVLTKGSNVYIRLMVTRNTGTFDLYIADIFFANMCTNGKYAGKMKIDPCWGIPVSDYTWYRGLSQWMVLKAKTGGAPTYTWTISGPGTATIVGSGYRVYLFEANGPLTVSVFIKYSHCSYTKIFNIAYNDTYWAGTPTDPWLIKICENGIDYSVPYKTAKQKVCIDGTATLGSCPVPKTNVLEIGTANVELYPNPVNSMFSVNLTSVENTGTIELYDLSGQRVFTNTYETSNGNYSQVFDVSNLSAGIYVLRIITAKEMISRKVIVE